MVEIYKSQKGADQIIKDNFIYGKKRISNNLQEWRCVNRTCRAIGRSALNYEENLNSFFLVSDHNHEVDYDYITKKRYLEKIKQNLDVNNFRPKIIVNKSLTGAEESSIGQ